MTTATIRLARTVRAEVVQATVRSALRIAEKMADENPGVETFVDPVPYDARHLLAVVALTDGSDLTRDLLLPIGMDPRGISSRFRETLDGLQRQRARLARITTDGGAA